MDEQTLIAAERVINPYKRKRMKVLDGAERALQTFNSQGIAEKFREYQNRHLRKAYNVLKKFIDNNLSQFDLFRLAGFVGKEENFSNAVSVIIDPNRSHQLGTKPLQAILKKIEHRNPQKINAVLGAIRESKYIKVTRELYFGSTIPDIVVESDKFIIFIENKIRGGKETLSDDSIAQTQRQWELLKIRGQKKNISKKCYFGIFLSPEGKLPMCEGFIPLSVAEFVESISNILVSEDSDYNWMFKTFLQFYNFSD